MGFGSCHISKEHNYVLMMKPDILIDKLVRYLSGEASGAGKEEVVRWKNSNEHNKKAFDDFVRIRSASATRFDYEKQGLDAVQDWEQLRNTINRPDRGSPAASSRKAYDFVGKSRLANVYRAAAILLVAGFIGIITYQYLPARSTDSPKPALREITTEMGQRVNLTLSDGTRVLLNTDSQIRLPPAFSADKRTVFLKGQACFQVAKNEDKPFVIYSGTSKTKVLGTAFSIRAYPDDSAISVAVKEGRVAFSPPHASSSNPAVAIGREYVHYDRTTKELKTATMEDVGLYLGWVEGYLKFKNAPMAQVA